MQASNPDGLASKIEWPQIFEVPWRYQNPENCEYAFVVIPQVPLGEGAGNRARTDDLLITNQLLYQLSYAGICRTLSLTLISESILASFPRRLNKIFGIER